jgi:hypothetical protein
VNMTVVVMDKNIEVAFNGMNGNTVMVEGEI